jgi:hypothetical protein
MVRTKGSRMGLELVSVAAATTTRFRASVLIENGSTLRLSLSITWAPFIRLVSFEQTRIRF